MNAKGGIIEAAWQKIMGRAIAAGADPHLAAAMRGAFFGGAWVVIRELTDRGSGSEELSDREVIERIEAIFVEVRADQERH